MPRALRIKPFAERERSVLELRSLGIDQALENAIALLPRGSDRSKPLRDKSKIVNLGKAG